MSDHVSEAATTLFDHTRAPSMVAAREPVWPRAFIVLVLMAQVAWVIVLAWAILALLS